MKCLAAMATWNRKDISIPCIESYLATCSPDVAELHVVDNGSTDGMQEWLVENTSRLADKDVHCHFNDLNMGTAVAINSVWAKRSPVQHCMKIDSDVVWKQDKWLDRMVEVFQYAGNVGIVGLKRRDVWENPGHPDVFYRTRLIDLYRADGSTFVIEQANHVIGTCWLVRSSLINVIGALKQPGQYGFDDALYCLRANLAKYASVFLPDIEIEHIDPGEAGTDINAIYTRWKHTSAQTDMSEYEKLRDAYHKGERPIYESFEDGVHNKYQDFRYTTFSARDSSKDMIAEFGESLDYGSEP